jgi:hypothetical protein
VHFCWCACWRWVVRVRCPTSGRSPHP